MKQTKNIYITACDLRPAITALGKIVKRNQAETVEGNILVRPLSRNAIRLMGTDHEFFFTVDLETIGSHLLDKPFTASLVELQTRLEAETNDLAKLEIIKQIEQTRVQAELDVLGAQASYARQTGREDVALEIEGAIAEMTAPRPVRQPVDRPAPGAGSH